jgi:hypothetical protein
MNTFRRTPSGSLLPKQKGVAPANARNFSPNPPTPPPDIPFGSGGVDDVEWFFIDSFSRIASHSSKDHQIWHFFKKWLFDISTRDRYFKLLFVLVNLHPADHIVLFQPISAQYLIAKILSLWKILSSPTNI